jgi:ankyrin repeat protein
MEEQVKQAIDADDLDTLTALLREIPERQFSRDEEGRTSFLLCCSKGRVAIAEWLLAHGSSMEEHDSFGGSAFLCAVDGGSMVMVCSGCLLFVLLVTSCQVRYLLDQGASVHEMQGGTNALFFAAQGNHLELLQFLIDQGLDPHMRSGADGSSVLMRAALCGHMEVFDYLVAEHRCSVDEADREGFTVLLAAANGGHLHMLQRVLQIKPDAINDMTACGMKAFLCAACSGSVPVMQYLLETHLSQPDETDSLGMSSSPLVC